EEGIEFVADPGAHRVFRLMMADGRADAKDKRGCLRKAAKIRIAVFGAKEPVWRQRKLEAAADRPAGARLRRLIAKDPRDGGIEGRELGAARGVQEDAVQGNSEPSADRPLGGNARMVDGAAGREGAADACPFDIAFKPKDQLVELKIIASVTAANDAVRGKI